MSVGPVRQKPIANGILVDRPATGYVIYHGFSARESDGTPAVAAFNIREGGATGNILEAVELAANQSAGDFYERGINCEGDLYCEVLSGTVSGSIRYS